MTVEPILFHAIDDAESETKTILSNWNLEDDMRHVRNLPPIERPAPVPRRLLTLLQAGADPNLCDQKGQSPLHYAIENRRNAAIEYLHQFGADPNKPDSSGLTALAFSEKREGNVGRYVALALSRQPMHLRSVSGSSRLASYARPICSLAAHCSDQPLVAEPSPLQEMANEVSPDRPNM